MMSGGDRLSDLPDDLLLRVLYFTPAREGTSTSALSKRWRGLWRSSGVLNLDVRLTDHDHLHNGDLFPWRDAFVSAARSSLEAAAAADSPVTKLTFHVEPSYITTDFLHVGVVNHARTTRSPDVLTELLTLPAARRVEELRLAAGYPDSYTRLKYEEIQMLHEELRELSFLTLPSDTLRVLDVTSCRGLQPSPCVAFPRLASLRLSHCGVWMEHLQDLIRAAPALATIHLEFVQIRGASPGKVPPPPPPGEGFTFLLHCPAATELVLDRCQWLRSYHEHSSTTPATVKIDAPRLRRFTYQGLLRPLELRSKAPDLARVDLHFLPHLYYHGEKDAGRDLVTFWRLAQNFSSTKELKLRVNMLEDIAVVGTESQAKLLFSFRNLERLRLEGMHKLKGKTAAVAVANMLSCCPVLRDLRLNLIMAQPDLDISNEPGRCFLDKKYQHDLEKSIQAFNNRRLDAMVSKQRDGDARYYEKLSDLPALSSGHVFDCLLNTLSCVSLQFRLETNIFELKLRSNFAAKLIKFFAKNAAVLKEMHIDNGNRKMADHMNCKLEQWVTNSSEQRKTTFVVLPLKS
ncbi:hypothetical protein QYE76_036427 [Lolium multiflorum]|uniref:F-box domain-containing protein n=1 Tax=Lolium multiflorum TaxID=4521 RepID=A0AAD8VN31_LOLMU|nr:hypothetical protein QYE76_036427 [Lolium multiflorum]